MSADRFSPRQLFLLASVTLFWGFNWPVLKLGVSGYPPLSFRALSMLLGLPLLFLATRWMKLPLRVARSDWPELARLTLTNMIVWHVLAILAIQTLPPSVWAAVLYNGVLIFGFAQPAWLLLARELAPAASTLSVMLIPVLGTLSGAWWLGEALYWQDGAALLLIGVAIASVLLPPRVPRTLT